MSSQVRVVIADDEPLVRSGVRAVLGTDERIEVVAEAADGAAAVERVREHRPDVALLDIRMPPGDGLSAATEIARLSPRTARVLLTSYGDEENVAAALRGGCDGFLLKTEEPGELVRAVVAAAEGAAYLSPPVARRVVRRAAAAEAGRDEAAREVVERLSERERDVLRLLGSGLSNAEIAARLHLVEGTVKGYVSDVLRRLDNRNRVQAAILAFRAGLVD